MKKYDWDLICEKVREEMKENEPYPSLEFSELVGQDILPEEKAILQDIFEKLEKGIRLSRNERERLYYYHNVKNRIINGINENFEKNDDEELNLIESKRGLYVIRTTKDKTVISTIYKDIKKEAMAIKRSKKKYIWMLTSGDISESLKNILRKRIECLNRKAKIEIEHIKENKDLSSREKKNLIRILNYKGKKEVVENSLKQIESWEQKYKDSKEYQELIEIAKNIRENIEYLKSN